MTKSKKKKKKKYSGKVIHRDMFPCDDFEFNECHDLNRSLSDVVNNSVGNRLTLGFQLGNFGD